MNGITQLFKGLSFVYLKFYNLYGLFPILEHSNYGLLHIL